MPSVFSTFVGKIQVNFNKQALENQGKLSVFRRLLGRILAQIIILVLACLLLPGDTVFPRNFCFVFNNLRDTRLKGKRKGDKKARENAISARGRREERHCLTRILSPNSRALILSFASP